MENKNIIEVKFNVSEEQLENKVLERLQNDIEQRVVDRIASGYISRLSEKLANIEEQTYSTIKETVTKKLEDYVKNIYDNFVIKVPTSNSWNSETKEVLLKDYVLEQTQTRLENGIKYDSYGNSKKTCKDYFNELIEKEVTSQSKHIIEQETAKIRNEVNRNLKETFDNATKNMLSEQVFNMLMSTDTYKKVENGLKLLKD